jgi:hypothetical protein
MSQKTLDVMCYVCMSVFCHEMTEKLQPPCFSGISVPCHQMIGNPEQSHCLRKLLMSDVMFLHNF